MSCGYITETGMTKNPVLRVRDLAFPANHASDQLLLPFGSVGWRWWFWAVLRTIRGPP